MKCDERDGCSPQLTARHVAACWLMVAAGLLLTPSVGAPQPLDHLKCYKIKDSQARQSYSADLIGLTTEPGCKVKVPAVQLCVAGTGANITPTPPGLGPGGTPAGRFLCYKARCPKAALAPVMVSDEFGTRTVTPTAPKVFCAPEGTGSTTTTTLPSSTCGNGVVDPGETCDGNCPTCPAETTTCFTQTGSAATCDLRCHVPVQTCGGGDACCPYIAGGGGTQCNAGDDAECVGTGWQYRQIGPPLSWTAGQVLAVQVYGISDGDSVLFTTCTPDGSQNTDDTVIVSITDTAGRVLTGAWDDSLDPGILPRMAGWNCQVAGKEDYLSTAPGNDGGLIVGPDAFRLTVTLRGYDAATGGSAKLFIWWNGNSNPNTG